MPPFSVQWKLDYETSNNSVVSAGQRPTPFPRTLAQCAIMNNKHSAPWAMILCFSHRRCESSVQRHWSSSSVCTKWKLVIMPCWFLKKPAHTLAAQYFIPLSWDFSTKMSSFVGTALWQLSSVTSYWKLPFTVTEWLISFTTTNSRDNSRTKSQFLVCSMETVDWKKKTEVID
jgi:hypothetical protein